jgi:hypothetical protein
MKNFPATIPAARANVNGMSGNGNTFKPIN